MEEGWAAVVEVDDVEGGGGRRREKTTQVKCLRRRPRRRSSSSFSSSLYRRGRGRIRRRGYNDYYDYGAFFVVGDWRRAEELERQAFVVAGRLIPIVTVVIVVLVPWRFRQQSAAHLVGCHRRSRLFDDHELVVVERAHRQWVRSSC